MKTKPEILLSNNDSFFFYKRFLVTGSDETLINYVRDYIVTQFKKKNYHVDFSGSYNKNLSGDLFSEKKNLFLLKDHSDKIDETEVEKNNDQNFLIYSSNNIKTNKIKSKYSKLKSCLVVECYTLNRAAKEFTLKGYIKNNKLSISNDVYWYIVENFDNNYVFFINQLEILCLYNKNVKSINIVESAVSIENKIELNKIFFQIYKNNKILINFF